MRKMILRTQLLLAVLCFSLLAACGGNGSLSTGDPAPDFSLQNALGGTVALDDFQDQRPVLLYFHMAIG